MIFFCLSTPLFAQNSDNENISENYTERNVCVRAIKSKQENSLQIRSLASDENCESNEKNFSLILPYSDPHSFALVPKKNFSSEQNPIWPPLSSQWPAQTENGKVRIWNFTCLGSNRIKVLGVLVDQYYMIASILSSANKQSCPSAKEEALNICKEKYKGNSLYENCES